MFYGHSAKGFLRTETSLAKACIVTTALALSEKDIQAFCHIDSKKPIEITNKGANTGESDRLCDCILGEMFSSKCCDLEIESDHEGTV